MNSISGSSGLTPIQIPPSSDAGRASEVSTPTVATQAPMSATMPAPPSEAALSGSVRRQSGSEAPVSAASVRASLSADVTVSTTPSRAAQRAEALNISAETFKKSADQGVNTASRSFFSKVAATVVGGVVVGLAAALTAATAGATAPLLALACVNLAVSAGDARCSYHNYRNAVAVAEGRAETNPKMPMGNSCIANCIHTTLTFCGIQSATAKTAANVLGGGVTLGLGIAAALISGGATQATAALELALATTKYCGAGLKLALATVGKFVDRQAVSKLENAIGNDANRSNAHAGSPDPGGLASAEELLAPLTSSKPVMPHRQATTGAASLREGLTAAGSLAQTSGVMTTAQQGILHLLNLA